MANEDQFMNPYESPSQMTAAMASKTKPRTIVKTIVLAIVCSVVLGLGLAILFGFIGRGIALATFESNPNDGFESQYGVEKALARHVVDYLINFAVVGFFAGVSSPWFYLLYSWFRKPSPANPQVADTKLD